MVLMYKKNEKESRLEIAELKKRYLINGASGGLDQDFLKKKYQTQKQKFI